MVIRLIYYLAASVLMLMIAYKIADVIEASAYAFSDVAYIITILTTYCIYFILTVWVIVNISTWVETLSYPGTVGWLFSMNLIGYYVPEISATRVNSLMDKYNSKGRVLQVKSILNLVACVVIIIISTLFLSPLIGGKVPW